METVRDWSILVGIVFAIIGSRYHKQSHKVPRADYGENYSHQNGPVPNCFHTSCTYSIYETYEYENIAGVGAGVGATQKSLPTTKSFRMDRSGVLSSLSV